MASITEMLDRLRPKRSRYHRRLRNYSQLIHKPTGKKWTNKGKWHDGASLWAYKKLNRKKKQIAKASRARNRQ